MVTGPRRLSLRELNRTTLARQWLLERRRATPAEAVGALAGLQAQHANSPYVALWSRVRDCDRILPDQHRAAVIKKNGDFLPTFLVDGLVAGLWVVDSKGEEAVLTISPFEKLTRAAHRELEAQAEQLVRFVEPEATRHAVTWRPVA